MQVRINGEAQDLPEGIHISELLDTLKLGGKRVAVEQNGELIPRSQHAAQTIGNGDVLEIVQAVGGG